MTAPMLTIEGLNAHYGRAHILFDVSLTVGRGEVVALMGRNGAGKSTTLKTVMGLVRTSSGTAAFDGAPVTGEASFRICQRGLGYVPEERRIFTDLTVDENLEVGRQKPRAGAPEWTREKLYEIFPNLANMRGRRASQMSGGEQQMLTIARTLMGNPMAVLLDEPSEGLAPVIVEQMAHTISSLKAEGLSLLLCEQNLHFANAVSDRAYVMESGHIRYEGTMADLYADDEVRQAYLTM
jgi:branched-chain amino acid transport system ATP-binding protein